MKNLIFLFALILGFVSCEEELPPPTVTPPPTTETLAKIVIFCKDNVTLDIDNVVFSNITTGQSETFEGTTIVNQECTNIPYLSQTFNVGVATNIGDEVSATINFQSTEYRAFDVMFLKSTQNMCDDVGGNVYLKTGNYNQYVITGTFN